MTGFLSRRRFLANGLALASLPLVSQAKTSSEPDLVIIGAGAAGLAATPSLLGHGLSVMRGEEPGKTQTDLCRPTIL